MVIVMKKPVYGVGVDDTDYQKFKKVNGKTTYLCEIYKKWQNMLSRCYSVAYKKINPSYDGVTVCDEWLLFSNFKAWVESQKWQGCDLDKDLISPSAKQYNPESCCFVTPALNAFIVNRKPSSLGFPVGVGYDNRNGTYSSYCNNPFSRKKERLGTFKDANSAHKAWKARKLELAKVIAEKEPDERAAKALVNRYLK